MSLKNKLAKLEQLASEILARCPADPRQTARTIAQFVKNLGLPPACIGLDENGEDIAGFSDPENPRAVVPLNRPVLRFMRLIKQVDELFGPLDDPTAIAA